MEKVYFKQKEALFFFLKKPKQIQETYEKQNVLASLSAVLVLLNSWSYSSGKPRRYLLDENVYKCKFFMLCETESQVHLN